MKRPSQFLVGAVFGTAALLLLPACSGPSIRSDSTATTQAIGPEPAADRDTGTASESGELTDGTEAGGTTEDSDTIVPAVISTATISLVSDDVTTTRHDVQRVLDTQHGTISEENGTTSANEPSYLRMVVRVPAARFDQTLQALGEVATVTQSSRTSEDVTTEVIDNRVRVRAQQASLRRVETLLAQAETMKDVVWIESQLTQRQSDLDSLKQRQAWLADQTSMATITLDITRTSQGLQSPPQSESGFIGGLRDGWHGLTDAASGLARLVGLLLPFLLPIVLLGATGWWLLRLWSRRISRSTPADA